MTKRYDEYKDSGVEWLGEIPSHWGIKRLKSAFKKKGLIRGPFGSAITKDMQKKSGIKVYEQKNAIRGDVSIGDFYLTNEDYHALKRFEVFPNDIIMSCSGTVGKTYIIPNEYEKGIINQALLIMRLKNDINKKYFKYFFDSEMFQEKIKDNSNGGAIKNLVGMDVFKLIEFLKPIKEEQQAIADYLDNKTSKIDNAVSELEKQKSLLIELKKSTIHQAVTKGLDLTVPMKDSRVEWIGEVPSNWNCVKMKKHLSIFQGHAFKSSDYQDKSNVSLFRMGNIKKGGKIRLNHNEKFLPNNFSFKYKDYLIKNEDILFSMTDLSSTLDFLAVPCFVSGIDENQKYLLNQRVGRLNIDNNNILKKYIYYILLSESTKEQLKRLGYGTVQSNLSSDDLMNLICVLPKKETQKAIVEYLDFKLGQVDQSIEVIDNQIAKMKEYKKTLINDVVTGKIKVV